MSKIISQVIWRGTLVTSYEDGSIAFIKYNSADGVDLFPNESRPTPNQADALPCGHNMGTVESDNYIVCSVCGRHVRRLSC